MAITHLLGRGSLSATLMTLRFESAPIVESSTWTRWPRKYSHLWEQCGAFVSLDHAGTRRRWLRVDNPVLVKRAYHVFEL
jgi:hypothetical protein